MNEEKKQKKFAGTGTFHPHKTARLKENLACIRQDDVNFWFYQKGETVIAVDCGYPNHPNLGEDLQRLKIDPQQIKGIFLTHGDLENAGGLCSQEAMAPNATIYLHEKEEGMITAETFRYKSGLAKRKNPLDYQGEYHLFTHEESIKVDNITVQCIHCGGHTLGHSVFLVDRRYLFTGDSLALNEEGGHCYFDLFNMDTSLNLKSLRKLKEFLVGLEPETVFTAHHGTASYEKAFSRINQVAVASKKSPFCPDAPHNVFENE